jgi:hypothetical protein
MSSSGIECIGNFKIYVSRHLHIHHIIFFAQPSRGASGFVGQGSLDETFGPVYPKQRPPFSTRADTVTTSFHDQGTPTSKSVDQLIARFLRSLNCSGYSYNTFAVASASSPLPSLEYKRRNFGNSRG